MKKFFLFALCCLLLTFSGCSDVNFYTPFKEEKSVLSTDSLEQQTVKSDTADNDSNLYLEQHFGLGTTMSICFRKGDEMLNDCRHAFETPADKILSLSLLVSADPHENMELDFVPMRLYALGDGKPLKYRLKNYDNIDSSEIYSEINIEIIKETRIDIDVDLSGTDDIKLLTIICDYLPETIPQKGVLISPCCMIYSMENPKNLIETETDEDGDKSLYYELSCKNAFIDIGVNSLENVSQPAENYTYYGEILINNGKDIDLNGKSKALYLKFNSGVKSDTPYYMLLFCDGKLLNAFDGEYSKKVNCHFGERSFQFRISEEYIPQDGLHVFYAVAFPLYNTYSDFDIKSLKIRVCI